METLKLYPLIPSGFDMTLLPNILGLLGQLGTPTLTEDKHHIFADVFYLGLDFRLDLEAAKGHPFEYRHVHGQNQLIGGIVGEVVATASGSGINLTVLSATGLHAPVVDVMNDVLTSQYQEVVVDLAEPGPVKVKPAGATDGTGGDTLYVPGVHAIFDLRGVPGHELVELKPGDKVEVSKELFHNKNALNHDLISDGHGGWLLAVPGDSVDSVDLELANGHALTRGHALSALLLHA